MRSVVRGMLVVAVVLLGAAPAVAADGPGVGTPTVVTLGDSAISGEAGRWAGNTNGSSSRIDALGPTAYWGQLAMRNCLRLAYNGGAVRGGKCVRVANVLDSHGEPRMGLQ